MNTTARKAISAVITDIHLSSTPDELCGVATRHRLPSSFTHLASPYVLAVWGDKAGKRRYFDACARLLLCSRGNAILVHGSEKEGENACRIFAAYRVKLEEFPFIISPTGVLLPRPGKPIDPAESRKGVEIVSGLIDKAGVMISAGLMGRDCVLDTMQDILKIARAMHRHGSFSIVQHHTVIREAHHIIYPKEVREWDNPSGIQLPR